VFSIKKRGTSDRIIRDWLNNIQNLLRPYLRRVNPSMKGPKRNFKVQGIMVIDNKDDISKIEAPLTVKKVVRPNPKNPAGSP
tara:strand:+ start:279 stop:524 length:246 start_codon:yes stop_codon:yes gene_type:complete